jgi:hypothetical protein
MNFIKKYTPLLLVGSIALVVTVILWRTSAKESFVNVELAAKNLPSDYLTNPASLTVEYCRTRKQSTVPPCHIFCGLHNCNISG